jgi:energy-coupling factor transporter ATP-binding protein EcfA2
MDFYQIKERPIKSGVIEIYPDFVVSRSKDLMVRGGAFYAIWDEIKKIWSTDEYDVQRLMDEEMLDYQKKLAEKTEGVVRVRLMKDFSTKSWGEFRNYMKHISDSSHQLDMDLTFLNSEVKKKDYRSKRLPYPLEEGTIDAYDEIMGTLYEPEERAKLEWAIGSIVAGDSKDIQKFIVLYGAPGTGKSTVLNIIQKLFEGYYTTFEARALASGNNGFATEVFRANPLVAIQHDGDLSRIEDNTKLNSIISHEEMTMNEKFKPAYTARVNCFAFMGTNNPVKISNAKSGIIRRLIDVHPSGKKIPVKKYHSLVARVDFELGAIAYHCLQLYNQMGKNYYSNYRALDMILKTDVFFNFVEDNFLMFKEENGVSLNQAYSMYKEYCKEATVDFVLPRHKFREELKNYFEEFCEMTRVDGKQVRSYYSGFITSKFTAREAVVKEAVGDWLDLNKTVSIFDEVCAKCLAQYANEKETPYKKWANVTNVLDDIDTQKLHYVAIPNNHIVIDFDLKNTSGEKSAERNIEAASTWPPTYAEYSKSGAGLHLHYFYSGDVSKLSSIFDQGIEVKVFNGDSSLRRMLSKCNDIPIAVIKSGLPLKEEKVINVTSVQSEKGLRNQIERNLRKEIHAGTKSSMDFIYKILDDAYKSDLKYDVTDMRPRIMVFANNSTHQPDYCLKLVSEMKFKSEEISVGSEDYETESLVFFDVEVFPNLLMINWKIEGEGHICNHMINPKPSEIEQLFKMKLVGYNCRRYDNHILYARYIGYNNAQVYDISQRIINDSRNALFGEAYNISYADIYDFSSVKQSLKKFQIQLGIHHQELGLPWDQPVDESLWEKVAEYCDNDVISEEVVFNDRKEDFVARQILADLSGLTVNDTTQMHTAKIIFGDDPKPQSQFVYTDLSVMFPGYKYEGGKSSYRGEDPGEGGNVYSEPGMYTDVALKDVASMHPRSAVLLNAFGKYTKYFEELMNARLAIKHKDFDLAKTMLGGKLAKYLTSPESSGELAYALKIVINIVYGLTSAHFDNKFRDPRNVDNIIAKRGALFMIDLKHAVQEKGFVVAHIKTDSIKIPDATQEIIDFVADFGKEYGYTFEYEAFYDRFCLVNDAVYIARYATKEYCEEKFGYVPSENRKHPGEWTATGSQFAQPYVFKTLFSKEPIVFSDLCETKTVTTALYLDMNEHLEDGNHSYQFVGKAGLFCPIKVGCGGGVLLREKDGKYHAATGSKGYRWLEAEKVKELGKEGDIDYNFYHELVDEAIKDISKFGDFTWFVSDDSIHIPSPSPKILDFDIPPWKE